MSQVPAPFHSASIPLTPTQWKSLHHLLHAQISLYPHVRKGPNPTSHPRICTTDPWDAWLDTFIGSDEVRQLFDNTPVAAIWASTDGRARIIEAAKPVVTVMAWIERVRIKEWGGYTDGQSGAHRNGSGQGPNSGTRGDSSTTAGATLGPVFVVSLT
ncbi:hypothetical protein B9Z19DRAFT_1193450 [Tuber borchii]|uniref:Uncharacterized protein n=1 Tax=Tuber borchii TaxID=42251 RepID=A0A2T6ZRY7_TUBBO|nr:hypothetical protein B9Z19DRAFT_1193450 [Tuber borchii]